MHAYMYNVQCTICAIARVPVYKASNHLHHYAQTSFTHSHMCTHTITPSCPHTLTLSHPHSFTLSLPHTLTPSHHHTLTMLQCACSFLQSSPLSSMVLQLLEKALLEVLVCTCRTRKTLNSVV